MTVRLVDVYKLTTAPIIAITFIIENHKRYLEFIQNFKQTLQSIIMYFSASTIILPLLAATPLASAWKLTVWMNDGRSVTTHGHLDSGCKTYEFNMNSPVKRAYFDSSISSGTFELYAQKDCNNLSYRNNEGTYDLNPPRIIRSYKVR